MDFAFGAQSVATNRSNQGRTHVALAVCHWKVLVWRRFRVQRLTALWPDRFDLVTFVG